MIDWVSDNIGVVFPDLAAELISLPLVALIVHLFANRRERAASKTARITVAKHSFYVLRHYFDSELERGRELWMSELDTLYISNAMLLTSEQQLHFNFVRTSLKILQTERRLLDWDPKIFMGRYEDFLNSIHGLSKSQRLEYSKGIEQEIAKFVIKIEEMPSSFPVK
ncbi:MAG: hypothetical protein KDA46_01755 [Parvularculaceae bacterium]|nr:hypothetical protein [Parvularculaceae bacterium]